jgi:hypothetical protein
MSTGRPASSPSEKLIELYFAIGVAMTMWQQIEMALTQLFCVLLKPQDRTASAVFNSVRSFSTKLAMIKAAAAVRLANSELMKDCMKLCDRLNKKTVKKRNQLAHFVLCQKPVLHKDGEQIDSERIAREIDRYLSPTAFDGALHWRHKGHPPQLKLSDIQRHAKAFTDASEDICDFVKRIEGALALTPH